MRPLIDLEGGILSVDDTGLDKPHSRMGKTDLAGYFYNGLHGKAVKGINLVTPLPRRGEWPARAGQLPGTDCLDVTIEIKVKSLFAIAIKWFHEQCTAISLPIVALLRSIPLFAFRAMARRAG